MLILYITNLIIRFKLMLSLIFHRCRTPLSIGQRRGRDEVKIPELVPKMSCCRTRGLLIALGSNMEALSTAPFHSKGSLSTVQVEGKIQMSDKVIIAYLFGARDWKPEEIRGDLLTHINYAFGVLRDGKVVHKLDSDGSNFRKLRELKALHPHLKTLISIGGWQADGFSDAVLTEESRKVFVDTAMDMMLTEGFDGVDLDWEYPSIPAGGIKARPEDRTNYTLFIKSLRKALDAQGAKDGKHYLLTTATGASQSYIDGIELDKIANDFDLINLMTYDFIHGGSTETGHHTNLYSSAKGGSADNTVEIFVKNGAPREKLVVGCGFYGRGLSGVTSTENNGLFQPATGTFGVNFGKLTDEYIREGGYTKYWDDAAKAPYLFNGKDFITYDDTESVRLKGEYVVANGLAGVMFWEYNNDPSGTLLQALAAGIRK